MSKITRVVALRLIERICLRCVDVATPQMQKILLFARQGLVPYRRKGDDEIKLVRGHMPREEE